MNDAGAGEKLKVFISYSRKDSAAFADELMAGLDYGGFAPFLDRHDIVAGEEWEARLAGLIEQSDTVVFIVSPEAIKSDRCAWEVGKTLALSKRLLPVIHIAVPDNLISEKLSRLQFVRFDAGRGITRPLKELADALRQDLNWIREHTRLGEIATRWDRRGRPESLLLRGDDINAAKKWMAARSAAAPEITDAQRAFIKASEEAEATQVGKERAQLIATVRLRRIARWAFAAAGVMIVIAGDCGVFAMGQGTATGKRVSLPDRPSEPVDQGARCGHSDVTRPSSNARYAQWYQEAPGARGRGDSVQRLPRTSRADCARPQKPGVEREHRAGWAARCDSFRGQHCPSVGCGERWTTSHSSGTQRSDTSCVLQP